MASITKRGNHWFVQVRRKGHPAQRKSFSKRANADAWARNVEARIDQGQPADLASSTRVLMSELFTRYREGNTTKRNAKTEGYMLGKLDAEFGQLALANVTVKEVSAFRDKLLASGRAPSTVLNYLHLLSSVIGTAVADWGYHAINPVSIARKPTPCNERVRRLTKDEETRLLAAAEAGKNPQLHPIVVVATETGMRLGELLALRWDEVNWDRRFAHVADSKNKDKRNVPLTARSIDALRSIQGDGKGRVFSAWARSDSFNKGWKCLLRRAGIEDLRFHDLRHEACSRLTEMGLSPLEVASISGHRSMQMLKRYSHFGVEHLLNKIEKGS